MPVEKKSGSLREERMDNKITAEDLDFGLDTERWIFFAPFGGAHGCVCE
jgi:hypothetical protein